MARLPNNSEKPFGEADCESELRTLGENYQDYYFYHTRFNADALKPDVYLIVGRRGSGKTALSRYLSFRSTLPDAVFIDVDEPKVYQDVLAPLSATATTAREVAIPRLARVWDFVIWSVIFHHLRDKDPRIRDANVFGIDGGKASQFIRGAFRWLLTRFGSFDPLMSDHLEELFATPTIAEGKQAVLEFARSHPIVIAFDTLENYAVHDEDMMRATAALIECAAQFNPAYASKNIHLKLFMMAEVFPYLLEEAITNSLKYVKNELYLHWRPKDLMRLLSWRLSVYLEKTGIQLPNGAVRDWDDHREVRAKMWTPFFGRDLTNGRGLTESTFPYVLRHTQLRPRQLIVLANEVARQSLEEGTFPRFTEEQLRSGVKKAEQRLATEVVSAFSSVYPRIGQILDALNGMPAVFKGRDLDKRAHQTASQWPAGEYSAWRFRQIVSELGVVGRVRTFSADGFTAEADFEYAMETRLPILEHDICAMHPMFYQKLRVQVTPPVRLYPFPDHPEFIDLNA
ncbi:hypothetical protein [Luteitalea sp.]|uniref:P-loop ATPase, Sll1717 family n=1 Tax=Luteitalea sp. TaxID=2004800 RepID=UPI0025BD8B15|nr:hypothetical protein [Luteitalea sp.]